MVEKMAANESDENIDYGGSLRKRIWITRGVYFGYSDRLEAKSSLSVAAITLLSFYVVVISLITLVYGKKFAEADLTAASCASIILSIFIIIITLFESSMKYEIGAKRAADGAHKLEDLYNRYTLEIDNKTLDAAASEKFAREYSRILQEIGLRQGKLDYYLFQFSNRGVLNIKFRQACMLVVLILIEQLKEYSLYAGMTLIPLVLFLWFLCENWTLLTS